MTVFPSIHGIKKSSYKKCVSGFIPKTVLVPLRQDINGECRLLVEVGDSVKEGQLIAQSSFKKGKTASCIYSPIPGKIISQELCVCPDGKTSHAVRIKLEGSFTYLGKKKLPLDVSLMTRTELIEEIGIKGIVNTFVSTEPVLLSDDIIKSYTNSSFKLLVVRLFDEDSSRYTDSLLSKFYAQEILEGSRICARALDASGIIFVVGKDFNRPDTRNLKIPVFFAVAKTKLYPSLNLYPY